MNIRHLLANLTLIALLTGCGESLFPVHFNQSINSGDAGKQVVATQAPIDGQPVPELTATETANFGNVGQQGLTTKTLVNGNLVLGQLNVSTTQK